MFCLVPYAVYTICPNWKKSVAVSLLQTYTLFQYPFFSFFPLSHLQSIKSWATWRELFVSTPQALRPCRCSTNAWSTSTSFTTLSGTSFTSQRGRLDCALGLVHRAATASLPEHTQTNRTTTRQTTTELSSPEYQFKITWTSNFCC